MRYFKKLVLPVFLGVGLVACDDATGPSQSGEVEAAAVGDDGSAAASSSPSEGGPSYSHSLASEGSAEGTVDFRARVYIRSDAGQWLEVTNQAAQSATVDASGKGGAQTFASSRVQARSYNRVRVVFEDVRANVTGGVQIGVGGVLQGEVRVDFGGSGNATVERDVNFSVRNDARTRLIVDLNSDAWLSRTDAQTKAVSRADFESAVRVFAS